MTEQSQDSHTDAQVVFDLSDLPQEVVNYAFDQFEDRLAEMPDEVLGRLVWNAKFGYEEQTVEFPTTIVSGALEKACREKLTDIRREIERGERTDYKQSHIEEYRHTVDDIFGE